MLHMHMLMPMTMPMHMCEHMCMCMCLHMHMHVWPACCAFGQAGHRAGRCACGVSDSYANPEAESG